MNSLGLAETPEPTAEQTEDGQKQQQQQGDRQLLSNEEMKETRLVSRGGGPAVRYHVLPGIC